MTNNNIPLTKKFLTANELSSLSSKNIERYCFLPGNKTAWETEFNAEIIDNIEKYEILKTLSGEPLSYIKSKIFMIMSNWLPKGTKLNPRLCYTIQDIISKNKTETRNASLTGETNEHIMKSCIALTTIINKAFENSIEQ